MTRPENQPPRSSIQQVAQRAGVSVGTVSNVLNNPHRVAEGTRRRVEQAIAEVGFVRNEAARRLRGAPSRVVGCVLLDLANPFFAEVARGVEERLAEAGHLLILSSTDVLPSREEHHLRALQEIRVRGILLNSVDPFRNDLSALARRGIPVVLVDHPRDGQPLCAVAVDNRAGGRMVAEHLLDLGHRRIGLLRAGADVRSVTDRVAGAREAVLARGLDLAAVILDVPIAPPRVSDAAPRALDLALSDPLPPTALLCFNDSTAIALIQALRERGLRVPTDMSVTGYDDIVYSAVLAPALTTVRQPQYEFGRAAAELLLAEEEHGHQHREILFHPELVVRESSAPPARRPHGQYP